MRLRSPRVAAAVLLATIGAISCSDGGGSGPDAVPTSVTVTPATASLNAFGATQQLTATVKDQNGKTMSGQALTWESADAAVATVSGTGVVTAVANGSAQITATAGSASGSASVTVQQAAGAVQTVSGNAQTDTVLKVLADSLVAQVNDARGNPVAGAAVSFSASGGVVSPSSATTNAQGRAGTQWTLPSEAGDQTVTATAGSASAEFTASAVADVADSIFAVSGDGQSGTVSAALANPITVRVVDQYGNPVGAHGVAFAPSGGGSALPTSTTTNVAGEAATFWTLDATLGAQSLTVTAGGLKGEPVTFGATGLAPQPASITIVDGDAQVGLAGSPVNVPPLVKVTDNGGNPFPGATVTFAVTGGGGSVTGGSVVTDGDGLAEVGSWAIGSGANSLSAAVTGVTPVEFTAVGQAAAFDIELRFVVVPSVTHQTAFVDAESKWEEAVFGDLPAQLVREDSATVAQYCEVDVPGGLDETVDDLVIYVRLEPIDGPFGVVGKAGPCLVRPDGSRLPVVGRMIFDTDDLDYLNGQGQLQATVIHEMAHVLGLGPLWGPDWADVVRDTSNLSGARIDTYYAGEAGRWAFDRIGGLAYVDGQKVPVEDGFYPDATTEDVFLRRPGTLNVHWRERVFESELMTGVLDGGANPLSTLSIAAMTDLGYLANYSVAGTFVLPSPAAFGVGRGVRIDLGNDVADGPIGILGPDGRIVRVIYR